MPQDLSPVPSEHDRRALATRIRDEATFYANERTPVLTQENNGETVADGSFSPVAPWATFTKGLTHGPFGELMDMADLEALIAALNQDSANAPTNSHFPQTYSTQVGAAFAVPTYAGPYAWPHNAKGTLVEAGSPGAARKFESPIAGHTFEINGPDADAVQMPPAPALGSPELIAEMAEVYAMGLLRDLPFAKWEEALAQDATFQGVLGALNGLAFFSGEADDAVDKAQSKRARARRRHRFIGAGQDGEPAYRLTAKNLFRGSTPGAHAGPYVSQFLLIGNPERSGAAARGNGAMPGSFDALNRASRFGDAAPSVAARAAGQSEPKTEKDGIIRYGIQGISQRYAPHKPAIDHMTAWSAWLDVQNGANRKDLFDEFHDDGPRFISTGRDLATYVHYDQLYQAYLNACLILLSAGAPLDIGLPEGPVDPKNPHRPGHPTRDGFATFGGPHILTLVTEVATRALKAVRRQKFTIHLRARPEAIAGALTLAWNGKQDVLNGAFGPLDTMVKALNADGLLDAISAHNAAQNKRAPTELTTWFGDDDKNALLPMAFPEGSPMHPSYGAGHATVAGACVTVLKAFFEMFALPEGFADPDGKPLVYDRRSIPFPVFAPTRRGERRPQRVNGWLIPDGDALPEAFFAEELTLNAAGLLGKGGKAFEANPDDNGATLREYAGADTAALTIQGELDKLAANVAIGRDFAGVHYYTDYYESLRMGERIAVGMLQEQMLTYREPLFMRLRSFDGDYIAIVGTGGSVHSGSNGQEAIISVWDKDKRYLDPAIWWKRGNH